jgi:hypothetical protein
MRTVDFLPPEAFENHLERRRTPRRLSILGAFLVVCSVVVLAIRLEAKHQLDLAEIAEAPNAQETAAGEELSALYREMNDYVDRLDPLADHLRMPVLGGSLAELAGAAGEFVQVEKIEWEHSIRRKGLNKVESAEIHLAITSLVSGDSNLIELPQRLQDHTGFRVAFIDDNTELIEDMRDTMRATVRLRTPLLVPGFDKPRMHAEVKR